MPDKHLSSKFDADLNLLSSRLLEMGGLVESQIAYALEALKEFDTVLVDQVLEGEHRLNDMEIKIDEEVTNIIARRQPAARDLRFLMATSKCITNLERAGDEARKIVKRTRRIQANVGRKHPSSSASDDRTLVEPVFRKERPKRSSDGEFVELDDPRRLRRVEPLATQAPFDLGPGIAAAGPEVPESGEGSQCAFTGRASRTSWHWMIGREGGSRKRMRFPAAVETLSLGRPE